MSDVKELNVNNTTYDIKAKSVVDTNSGKLKFWSGTRQEYDAIVTKDANTLYNITDDTDVTLPLLELLYPVGAVYFGTMSVCPLQVLGVGTWQALPQDKVIQIAGTRGSVGDTLSESLPNIKGYFSANRDNVGVVSNSGALYPSTVSGGDWTWPSSSSGQGTISRSAINLDASRSSSTYKDNAPVQQDAYLLNGWRRIS